jgi:hypothetical protein
MEGYKMINKRKVEKYYNELEAFKEIDEKVIRNSMHSPIKRRDPKLFPLKERARKFSMTESQYIEFFTLLELLQEKAISNLVQGKLILSVVISMLSENIYLDNAFPLTFSELGNKYKEHKKSINMISEIYDNDLYKCIKQLEGLIPLELKGYYEIYLKHIILIQDKNNELLNQSKETIKMIEKPIINDAYKNKPKLSDNKLDFDNEEAINTIEDYNYLLDMSFCEFTDKKEDDDGGFSL